MRLKWRCASSLTEWRLKYVEKFVAHWYFWRIQSKYLYLNLDFLLTVTTIMKTVIGAGILSLPFTISKLGYVFALIVFGIVISLTQFSCYILLKAKNLSRHSNYSTIMYHLFRKKWSQVFCSLLILLNNIGICNVSLI